jgi:hypothetical protein
VSTLSTGSAGNSFTERGFATIQYVLGVAFSLVLLVLIANLLVDVYARGAVRDALDEGVRAAVPIDAPVAACEQRAHDVLSSLVQAPLAAVDVRCRRDGPRVVADAHVSMRSWLPVLVPDWRMDLHAAALQEG